MFDENADEVSVMQLTAEVVAAYVSNHTVNTVDLPQIIRLVAASLQQQEQPEVEVKHAEPAVPVRKSVTRDFIICLECGKKQRTLKRHLATAHGLAPEEYRQKYRLSSDYPLVAQSYAEQRSAMAKEFGLGRQRKQGTIEKKATADRPKRRKRSPKAA